jgi:VIT1/CCC1 family predicted Fe2+/Mn2+ transporter
MDPPSAPRASDLQYHTKIDPHRGAGKLAEIILGGQDGLVNVLGVVLGVGAATSDARVVLVSGLAAAFAESVSMAAVAYTSNEAQARIFESERQRELRHVERVPDLEREEVRELYRGRGFEGELLERIVEKITSDPDVWVAVMMAEEHRLTPVSASAPWRSAAVVGIASLVGSLIPLVPFFALNVGPAMIAALALGAAALFATGIYKAKVTTGSPTRSGLQLALIGMACALLGYGIGFLLKLPTPP